MDYKAKYQLWLEDDYFDEDTKNELLAIRDDEKEIDKGGSDNYLLGAVMSGVAVTGYNNYNCNIEKYSGEEIPNDCDKPQNIFEF